MSSRIPALTPRKKKESPVADPKSETKSSAPGQHQTSTPPLAAAIAVRESDLVVQHDKGGLLSVQAPNQPAGTWLSFYPDGSVKLSQNLGEYELGTRVGDKLFFTCLTQYPTGCFGVPIAVGL